MVEVMFFLLGALEDQRGVKRRRRLDLCIQAKYEVCILPDSKYAMGGHRRGSLPTARKRSLGPLAPPPYTSGPKDEGDKMADTLATLGMDPSLSASHMHERLPIDDWGAQDFRDRLEEVSATVAALETSLGQEMRKRKRDEGADVIR